MRNVVLRPLVLAWIVVFPRSAWAEPEGLLIWPVDIHTKVLRPTVPPAESAGHLVLTAARNEYESGQFVVWSDRPIERLSVQIAELAHSNGAGRIGPNGIRARFVGYIPINKNTPDSELVRVAAAPCEIPDPLLEADVISLPAKTAQPVWITVFVPENAVPGTYQGTITVHADNRSATLTLTLNVRDFALPNQRHLLVTNWFNLGNIAKAHGVELYSDQFWQILKRYAINMAEHRQNVVLTPWTLIQASRNQEGQLSFDYTRFDRFVELFQTAGVSDGIEISHVGHPEGGWGGPVQLSRLAVRDERSGSTVWLDFDEGLRYLLTDLERHLEAKGWLDKAMIHISDEPAIMNVDFWREAAARVREAAPRLRRIDAIETTDFDGALEIWVPKLSQFDAWREAFERRRPNIELWYYICCHPYGNIYPNRFLDYPGASVRVLHWINYRFDLAGYLHWGWNFWGDDPFGVPRENLPPGDTHVVYPGREGPLDSIRWEIQRESIEDFEYLKLLETEIRQLKDTLGPGASWIDSRQRPIELARRVVPDLTTIEKDPVRILKVREEVAREIAELKQPPLGLVVTQPPEGTVLIHGPINLEVRGAVEPGTTVRVNGTKIDVRPDGRFGCRAHPRGEQGEVQIEFERAGQKKTQTRYFSIRKS